MRLIMDKQEGERVTWWHTLLIKPYIISLHRQHFVDLFCGGFVAFFTVGDVAIVGGFRPYHTYYRLRGVGGKG